MFFIDVRKIEPISKLLNAFLHSSMLQLVMYPAHDFLLQVFRYNHLQVLISVVLQEFSVQDTLP